MGNKFKEGFKKATATALVVGTALTAAGCTTRDNDKNEVPNNDTPHTIESILPQWDIEYTFQYGDTLYDVVVRYFGTENVMEIIEEIAEKNGISDPNNIKAGTVIKLPRKVAGVKRNNNTFRTYTVQPGDNLTTICKKVYRLENLDDAEAYRAALRLAEANKIDPEAPLLSGVTLIIPDYSELMGSSKGL